MLHGQAGVESIAKRGPSGVGRLVGRAARAVEQDDGREEEAGRGWEAREKKRREAGSPRRVRHRERNPIVHGQDMGLVIACSTKSQALEACDLGFRGFGGLWSSHWRPNPTMGWLLCVLEAFTSSGLSRRLLDGGDSYYS